MAITIAGAVSLGSYEAGVLYELLEALRQHNTQAKSEGEKIYVDVITGASAGGMTAAMAAQKLLYDAASLSDPQSNVFYQAWVATIDLLSLAKMKWKEDIWDSLFSSDLIESLGQQFLIDPLKALSQSSAPKTNVHPAIEVVRDADGTPKLDANGNQIPKPLWLGLALTNLDGLNYGYPILEDRTDKFQYTRCVDQMWRDVAVPPAAALDLWGPLKDAAVASGAFPFAFRAKAIERHRGEYPDPTLEGWPVNSTETKTFAYTDGGVLQNQPIGLAKNLIDLLIKERLAEGDLTAYDDADSRLYVFVSPRALQSGVSAGFTAAGANFARMTDELGRTYSRQAEFHDWIMAEQLNQQVNVLDERAEELAQALTAKPPALDCAPLKIAAVQLATLLYATVKAAGPDVAEAWVNSVLTLEAAGGLQTRDRMNILGVMANGSQELAGAGMAAFAGFFKRAYREHDYTVGRNKARQYLANADVQNIVGKMEVAPANLPDPSKITKLPVPLWSILAAGAPALLWMVVWRVIRWWPATLAVLILAVWLLWRY
jgi:predicted acylesterase/phospholipase RssA